MTVRNGARGLGSSVLVGLVACCKTKLDRAALARELYTSPLFRMSLAYAERCCERVYVASAQHDLLDLDRVIAPYERTVSQLTPMQRRLFGAAVARGLVDRHGSQLELLVLAGAVYVDPIVLALSRMGAPFTLHEPMRGMQIGERLSFLSRALRAESPAATVSPNSGGRSPLVSTNHVTGGVA